MKKRTQVKARASAADKANRRKPVASNSGGKLVPKPARKRVSTASIEAASGKRKPATGKVASQNLSSGNGRLHANVDRKSVEQERRPSNSSTGKGRPLKTGANHKVAEKPALAPVTRGSARKKMAVSMRLPRSGELNSAPATQLDPVQFPEEKPKKIKTPLTAKQLREFRELLLRKRAELAGDVHRLTSEALHRNDNGSNDHSTMPIHMADLGSDAWEQDFTLGLIANEEAVVREIDDALRRIDDKTYGICLATDKPISIARLYAKPWAKYCIEYARLREEGRAP